MKTVKYLAEQLGEYVYTPRNIREVYVGQEFDAEKDAGCIVGYDSWMHAPKKKFAVETREIPDWMEPEEFIQYEIAWKYYVIAGGTEELGRDAFMKLKDLEGALKVACIKLLKTK
jgi:hypothetical protein